MPAAMPAPSLARVARGDLCAGCGACAALVPGKVAMALSPAGFLRPQQAAPLTPAEDAAIAAVCPGLGQTVAAEGRSGDRTEALCDDPLWGPFLSMHSGHATDPDIRFAGASGGALSMLLVHLLETGAVDAVIQTAADPDRAIGNVTVVSTSREDVLAAAGSRYAPASPLAGLGAHLAPGRRLAFVGKPCDVAALRAMTARDPALAQAIPVMLSFFCAGTPGLAGGRKLLEALGTTEAETRALRYRGNGWPGQAVATLADGSTRSMSYADSWGKILSRHVQHRCRICADGTGVAADLVCADAWESDAEGYPRFADAPGRSLIVARTAAGAAILAAAVAAGRLETAPFDPAALAALQPGQRDRRQGLAGRLAALRLARRPVPRYRGLRIEAAAWQAGLGASLRNFTGMLRRIARPKRVPKRIP
jgi:coenzyme F420 hydrogenase subunit beta